MAALPYKLPLDTVTEGRETKDKSKWGKTKIKLARNIRLMKKDRQTKQGQQRPQKHLTF